MYAVFDGVSPLIPRH